MAEAGSTPGPARPGAGAAVAVSAGLLLWAAVAWVHLQRFAVPWMDPWCYLAPAAPGGGSLLLWTPLLGSFEGADHLWGLHFPGALLLYRALFAVLPFHGGAAVGLFVALWAALALAVGWAALQLTGEGFWGAASAAVVLADRSMFEVAAAQRPEFVAALALFLSVMVVARIPPFRGGAGLAGAFCGFFLIALAHPVTLVAGAIMCLSLAWLSPRAGGCPRRTAGWALAGYAAGCAALVLWFALQPKAWSTFRDHAGRALVPYSYGTAFWRALQEFYYPTFTGHVLWILGGLAAVRALWPGTGDRGGEGDARRVCAVALLACALAEQKFYNVNYLGVALPEAVVISALFLHDREGRPGSAWRRGFRVLVCAAILAHGLFWGTRTLKFLEDGRPDLRRELAGIAESLPTGRRILVPEVLWEEAIRNPGRFMMNTLPYHASVQRRRAYEAYAYAGLRAGDLVILDRLQSNAPAAVLPKPGWALVGTYRHVLPGRTEWGYDLSVWRTN